MIEDFIKYRSGLIDSDFRHNRFGMCAFERTEGISKDAPTMPNRITGLGAKY